MIEQQLTQQRLKRNLLLTGSLIVLLLLTLVGLSVGSSNLPMGEIPAMLLGHTNHTAAQVLFHIRIPRVLAAILSGVALAISGSVIQTVIRNPLGSPYTLGLSAASMFGAALVIVVSGYLMPLSGTSPYLITISAFLMGLLCALFITALARWRGASPETLIIAGIILSSLFNSGTSLLQYFSNDTELTAIVSWMFGDLGKADGNNVKLLLIVVIPSMVYFIYNGFSLAALNAGDEVAQSLGVKVNRLRIINILVASLCTAVTVAFFGIIAFVGLIIPHITRRLIGSNEPTVIIGSAILGAIFLLLSDIIARTVAAPIVIPVGIITSFVGAPFFLYLLIIHINHKRNKQ
ncbi:FecCD family ABC transporter permease [Geofilum sp. OHC36d9]|uniref:FecCD family ABC transporter permease n=1 Tax=Geofilum sp. OHC36d9 TaxID=3458413 RepID=UPI0040334C72